MYVVKCPSWSLNPDLPSNYDMVHECHREPKLCTCRDFEHIIIFFSFQDNYTFAQPGIQMKVNALRELIKRIDGKIVIMILYFINFEKYVILVSSFL